MSNQINSLFKEFNTNASFLSYLREIEENSDNKDSIIETIFSNDELMNLFTTFVSDLNVVREKIKTFIGQKMKSNSNKKKDKPSPEPSKEIDNVVVQIDEECDEEENNKESTDASNNINTSTNNPNYCIIELFPSVFLERNGLSMKIITPEYEMSY
jgi:hypothetical protein